MAENSVNPVLAKVLKKCQESVHFFIENFCKVEHPLAGLIPFNLFEYQSKALHAYQNYRFNIYKKNRQSGISTLTGAYCLWYAMFQTYKKVLIVSKRDLDAKEFLRKNVKVVFENLPDWMKQIFHNSDLAYNEHKVEFTTGSSITSLPSGDDTLRSNSASLVVIDEAAFMPRMSIMWGGGWSCVNENTYINVNGSLQPISSLGDITGRTWQDIDVNVLSDNGFLKSDKFYVNGVSDTYIIETELGYKIECTYNHRLKNGNYEWVYAHDINIGDKLALKCDFDYDNSSLKLKQPKYKKLSPRFNAPTNITEPLAEVVGYYIGDGYLSIDRPCRLNLAYDPQDYDIYKHFYDYFSHIGLSPLNRYCNGAGELRICNSNFVKWFVDNNFNSKTNASDATVPNNILCSSKSIKAAFLRGLFEADGWCYKTKNKHRPNSPKYHLGFSSISEKLVQQVQLLLLEFGIISKKSNKRGGYKNSKNQFRLELISKESMIKFMNQIGFLSKRKNVCISKKTNYKSTKYNIVNGIFYDKVMSKVKSKSLTLDISVPCNNTYVANGFISHNTLQHGGSVIVISTTKGIGNWYWSTWTDAKSGTNDFNPIEINWWDMDWELPLPDGTVIAPTKDLRPCETAEEFERYGPYWSPWLEEQYKGLQEKGEAGKFRQEVLAEFIGSGSTVLEQAVLSYIGEYQRKNKKKYKVQSDIVEFTDPLGDTYQLDFGEDLWIWEQPKSGHRYAMGFDPSGGESRDYTAIVIWDIDTKEQVAEYNGKVRPKIATRMALWLATLYNWAVVVVDRSGLGQTIAQELDQDLMYPALWKKKKSITDKGQVGLNITPSSKDIINKAIRDNYGLDGFIVNSPRLYKQLMIYINLGGGRTGHEPGMGNRDDLTIASGLGIIGARDDQFSSENQLLIPMRTNSMTLDNPKEFDFEKHQHDAKILMPISDINGDPNDEVNKQLALHRELMRFSSQLVSNNAKKKGETYEEWRTRIQGISQNGQSIRPNMKVKRTPRTITMRKRKP